MESDDLLQQCLKASKESLIEIDPNGELLQRQLWKIIGNTLINKANIWQSRHEWKFQSVEKKVGKIYIENTSNDRVLATPDNFRLVEDTFDKEKAGQKWKKGPANREGFFTLENLESKKFLTALKDQLVIKGNYSY